jgi:hypothetical protein
MLYFHSLIISSRCDVKHKENITLALTQNFLETEENCTNFQPEELAPWPGLLKRSQKNYLLS